MYINTLKHLTYVIMGSTLPRAQHLIASSRQSKRGKRKPRKDSSRGKLNTPFSQFIEATRFIRSIIKYTFIIWALVLGVYTLFNFASQATWRQKTTLPENTTVKSIDSNSTTASKDPAEDQTVISGNSAATESSSQEAQNPSPQKTATASIDEPDNNPALTSTSSATGPTLKVTAYSAMLFESLNDTQSKQTPLNKDSTVLLLERKGEWLKVITADKQTTGYVHSSQVIAY